MTKKRRTDAGPPAPPSSPIPSELAPIAQLFHTCNALFGIAGTGRVPVSSLGLANKEEATRHAQLVSLLVPSLVEFDAAAVVLALIGGTAETRARKERTAKKPPSFAQREKAAKERAREFTLALQRLVEEHPVNPLAALNARLPQPTTFVAQVKAEILSLDAFLTSLKAQSWYKNQIEREEAWRITPQRHAQYAALSSPLSANLKTALLDAHTVVKLYSHQATAINALEKGENVIVSTSTASGKSLIYQIPVVRNLEHDLESRAIFIFPTKALAQDQKRSFEDLLASHPSLSPHLNENQHFIATYDGDTPFTSSIANSGRRISTPSVRDQIRDTSRVIFTNFDTLHKAFLWHKYWSVLFTNLKLVVVDELHYYSDRLGTHCAMVMRRLKRLCALYGNTQVQFVSCSATIANPIQHMERFFDVQNAVLVDQDGSPMGKKHQIIWNPPVVISADVKPKKEPKTEMKIEEREEEYKRELDDDDNPVSLIDKRISALPERVYPIREAVMLCLELLRNEIRFICFVKSRNNCESLLKEFYNQFEKLNVGSLFRDKVMSYRGGYSKEERRDIEKRMFDGTLLGIVATSALELGVDIGSLDVVLHLGFPLTMASYRQQVGRAGRRKNDSASILIAHGYSSIDQYYVQNPVDLFNGFPDIIHIPFSTHQDIINLHFQCAAAEQPLSREIYTNLLLSVDLTESSFAAEPPLLWDPHHNIYHPARTFENNPAKSFQIRESEDTPSYRIIDLETSTEVEMLESNRAFKHLYDGAIFQHRGQPYQILTVFHEPYYIARARKTTATYLTKKAEYRYVDPYATTARACIATSQTLVQTGLVKVTSVSTGYFLMDPVTGSKIEKVETGNATDRVECVVRAVWCDDVCVPVELEAVAAESVHAAVHAVYLALGEGCGCEMHCFGAVGEDTVVKRVIVHVAAFSSGKVRGEATVKKVWGDGGDGVQVVLEKALKILEGCDCVGGCRRCLAVGYPICKAYDERLDRFGGIVVVKSLLGYTD
ncbi:hypothetical protein HDU79_005787 [Rhizoclosmatium sp. JEL0117]|nr:hypothetical protein HDU79_005787 [Rhizoclosmatium sp. JEL0117]